MVNSLRSVKEEEVALLVQSVASTSEEPVDLAEKLFTLNHDITTRIIFRKKFEDQERFRAAIKQCTLSAAGFHVGDFFPSLSFVGVISGMKAKLRKNFLESDNITDKIIGEHITKKKSNGVGNEDLVDLQYKYKRLGTIKLIF
ncbi:hypothetical protein SLE2022_393250 [Rubroshorea leprosula]